MGNLGWASADVTTTPCSGAGAENCAGSAGANMSSVDLSAALAGLGPSEEFGDSAAPMESVGGFANVVAEAQAWNQTLLRSRGGESAQNMQCSLESLSDAFFSRQKEMVVVPPEWEMRNFTGEDTSFCNITKENGFGHLLEGRLNNCDNNGLPDLGTSSSALQTSGHVFDSSAPAMNSFGNNVLHIPPMPQFNMDRIKKECVMLDTPTALSQGLESDDYSKQEFSDIIDSTNRSFLKAIGGRCYNNGLAFMQGEDHYPGLWSSTSHSTNSRFSASSALSQNLLSPSSPSLLNTNRNSPLWDLICSKPDLIKSQQSPTSLQNFPQFLQEGKLQMSSLTQHLNMDEARDCSNDGKRCSADSCTSDTIFKRPRLDSTTTSIPTFKVRKEKLGDRITALQQLVSPFGKTDTASVLLEAIGYIKFLHEQVQVLSTPYMNNGAANSAQGDQIAWAGSSDAKDSDGPKQDLRSRGLCLVPVSSTLSVTNDNGADYWAPALGCNFR